MRIIRNNEQSTLTLVPTEESQAATVAAMLEVLKPGDKLDYGGRRDATDTEKFAIHLYAGSRRERQTTTSGNITFTGDVHVGGVHLTLQGDSDDDGLEVRRLRDTCYWGTGGLIFFDAVEVEGVNSLLVTAAQCKLCGGNMLSWHECHWKMCSACKDKCEHVYSRGMIVGGDAGTMGMGERCEKCGRGKPLEEGERPKTQIEHHLAVSRELGVHVEYKNGPVATPQQAVQLARLVRRHRRSRSRAQATS
jgi:hypothetical protein